MSGKIRVVLWKELKDLSRDYKTIVYVVVMPLLALPGLAILSGGLYSAQNINVVIVDLDGTSLSRGFAEGLASYIESAPLGASLTVRFSDEQPSGLAGFTVVIRSGFSDGVSRLDGQAVVEVYYVPGVAAMETLEALVRSYVSSFERSIVESRVEALSKAAGIGVDTRALLDPIVVSRGYRTPSGAVAGEEARIVAFSAKVIAFSLFFVVNPAIVFMSDAIVGEKERRSIERLLTSPVSRRDLLAGKMAASAILSSGAAVADSLALIAFFILYGSKLSANVLLLASWIASVALLILMTSALVSIVASRSNTMRSAQAGSFAIMMIALAIYFSSFIVDYDSLPGSIKMMLSLIPFTHASLAVYRASLGEVTGVIFHIALLAAFTAGFAYLAYKSFQPEKLVAFR